MSGFDLAGKVPREMLEKKYGQAVRESVKEKIVDQAYQEALDEHDLESEMSRPCAFAPSAPLRLCVSASSLYHWRPR